LNKSFVANIICRLQSWGSQCMPRDECNDERSRGSKKFPVPQRSRDMIKIDLIF
jgi:hypothetical protein